jgi:TonB-linked SusC/RagA family outer membrane protein
MRKLILLAVYCLFLTGLVKGQTQEVIGTIVDSAGLPISGASVKIKGTKTGVSAASDGGFRISLPRGAVLVISAVGYGTQDVKAFNGSALTIRLLSNSRLMNEVVVTAIGINRDKRELGSATQTINADQLNKSGTGNALSELNGKASGLTVINSSGDPGAGTYIRLRGVTSITGNNQPLMVVDGVPIDNSINNYDPTANGIFAGGANGNLVGGVQPTNRGVDLNPNDIESVTLLKGPAATALYGIQASSGALIITTKKGTSNQGPVLTFNSSFSMDKVSKLPERQTLYSQGDAGKYVALNRLTWGALIDTLYRNGIADNYDPNGQIVGASNPSRKTKAVVYDPYKFFNTGLTYNNNIALSGGNGKSAYRMSLGNLHETGIVPHSKYDKTTFNVSGQSALTSKFSISGGVNFVRGENDKVQQGSNTSGVMLGLLRTPTTFDNSNGLKDAADNPNSYVLPNGKQRDFRGGPGYDNPYWTVNRVPFHEDLTRVFGYAQASYQVADWMTISYKAGGDVYSQNDKNAYDIGSNVATAGAVHLSDFYNQQYNSDFTVHMKKTFSDDWSGSLLLGQNYFTLGNHAKLTHGTGLTLPNFLDMANVQSYTAQEYDQRKRTSAYYGEGHLSYRDMLFLTVTGRRETSSTLPPKNNSFFYPSVSLAYEFIKPGMSASNVLLSYGKLRASFAQVGKDAPTQGLNTYYKTAGIGDGFTTGVIYPIDGISGYQFGTPGTVIGNPDLKAEKTNSYEFGADLGFLKNRVTLNATLYYSKSSDVILTAPVAYTSGFGAELLNAAVLTNKGLELTLNTTPLKTQDWRWDVNFNWARNLNIVKSLATGVDQIAIAGFTNGSVNAVPGQPYGVIYGNGYVRANPDDPKSPLLINDDKTDDGYGLPIAGSLSLPLAKVDPEWTGSVVSNVTYKNISFSVQLDVKHGGHLWDGTRGAMSYFGTSKQTANRGQAVTFKGTAGHLDKEGNIVHTDANGDVSAKPGGPSNVPTTYDQYYWQNIGNSFTGPVEVNIEDAGFVRIRQASLSYQLTPAALKHIGLKSLSLTVFTNNPLLWTKYKGVDPETSLAGPANGQGLDYFNGPSTKSYGLRLSMGL